MWGEKKGGRGSGESMCKRGAASGRKGRGSRGREAGKGLLEGLVEGLDVLQLVVGVLADGEQLGQFVLEDHVV